MLDQPPYDTSRGFAAHFADLEPSSIVLAGTLLVGFALLVWLRDGRPGLAALREWLRSRRTMAD